MDKAIDIGVQGSFNGTMICRASVVSARVGKGLLSNGQTGHVNYWNHYTECCHNPDMCGQGVTFAM